MRMTLAVSGGESEKTYHSTIKSSFTAYVDESGYEGCVLHPYGYSKILMAGT
jgi:hypothetical protein